MNTHMSACMSQSNNMNNQSILYRVYWIQGLLASILQKSHQIHIWDVFMILGEADINHIV